MEHGQLYFISFHGVPAYFTFFQFYISLECLSENSDWYHSSSGETTEPNGENSSHFHYMFLASYMLWWASLVAQRVKNLPAIQEIWVWSLGQEDPLEKGMATHSSILIWRIPWTWEPGWLQSTGLQRVGRDWATHTHTISHNSLKM